MKIILIRGPLGIGKTTIAKKLAENLGALYISFDKVLEDNGLDRIDDDFIPEDFIKANEIVLPEIKKALEEDKFAVLDGCFYFMEQIEHLEENFPDNVQVFDLRASLESCINRDKGRKQVYGEEAARAVYNLVAKFSYGMPIETEGKSEDDVLKEILESLR